MKRIIPSTPENRPPLPGLKGKPIFADIREYFITTFNALPRCEEIKKSVLVLREDLEAHYGKKYDYKQVLQLLEKGFLQEIGEDKGLYVFKRSDFISIIKTHFINEIAPAAGLEKVEEVPA